MTDLLELVRAAHAYAFAIGERFRELERRVDLGSLQMSRLDLDARGLERRVEELENRLKVLEHVGPAAPAPAEASADE